MSSEALDLSANINGFFEEVVHDAAQQRSCEVTDVSVSYVGGLLADYARPDALHDQTLDRSLTLLLDEALSLRGAERFERLRTLGDGVLYVSGFFAENLERRGVAHSYVRALGAQAYQAAAGTLRTGNASGPDVFRELARKFDLFVQLLSDVADSLRVKSARRPADVLSLYERWTRTGSPRLAAALHAKGLTPARGSGELS